MQSFFYDFIIFGFLIVDGLAVVYLLGHGHSKRINKNRRRAAIFLCTLAWITIFYGSFLEPARIVVTEESIKLSKRPSETLRVAVLGDLHVGPYKQTNFIKRLVKKTQQLKPDLILLAGDYIYDNAEAVRFLQPLKDLSAPYGVFAVLGNHDYNRGVSLLQQEATERGKAVRASLEALGIRVLVNDGELLQVDERTTVGLIGTDELWTHRASISDAVKTLNVNEIPHPLILLSHNPDIVYFADGALIDLVIAAHTHGGQIRLPLIGPVPQLPTNLGRFFDQGLFQFENTQLYITSGTGEEGPRARLFNPPEVVLLTLEI